MRIYLLGQPPARLSVELCLKVIEGNEPCGLRLDRGVWGLASTSMDILQHHGAKISGLPQASLHPTGLTDCLLVPMAHAPLHERALHQMVLQSQRQASVQSWHPKRSNMQCCSSLLPIRLHIAQELC